MSGTAGTPGVAAAKAAIRTRFDTLWRVSGQPRTPVHWNGVEPFNPPSDAPWVRLSILFGEGRRISIGPRGLARWGGIVTVQVFAPKGRGEGDLDGLCDEVTKLFPDGLTLQGEGPIRFSPPSSRAVRDDRWLAANVNCPFERDRA